MKFLTKTNIAAAEALLRIVLRWEDMTLGFGAAILLASLAVCHVLAGHSVLVAAHTSAGKTVVAEYAFAMALR